MPGSTGASGPWFHKKRAKVEKPGIRQKIFLTMAVAVAIPVTLLSLTLAGISYQSEALRRLDRFAYAQSYLSALIEDRNRLVTARTTQAAEDSRMVAALENPATMQQNILVLTAEYGLDGFIIRSKEQTASLHLLDQRLSQHAQEALTPTAPLVSPSSILLFHTAPLEPGGSSITGIGSIRRSELEVLRAGTGVELELMYRDDPLGTRIMTTKRDAFGRNLAGTAVDPPQDSPLSPETYPTRESPLGPEQRYTTAAGQNRIARLMALPALLEERYIAQISIPQTETELTEVKAYLVVSTLITIILAIIASHLLARQLVDPIQKLLQGIENLSLAIDTNKDFQPLNLSSRDEIGELTAAYNRMGVRLQSAHASLSMRNQALKELDLIKDQFLATTSRELRAPLNTIISLAESMAATSRGNPESDRNLRRLADTGRRLYGMVNDILEYTRLEHSDIELSLRTFELKPLVDTVVRFCSSIKNTETEIQNLVEPGRLVHGDEARLEQVLYRLVGRAIRRTVQGIITIKSWEDESILHISVSIAGSGEASDIRKDSAQRGKTPSIKVSDQQRFPEMDMGIATHLVKLHGGELELRDEPNTVAIIRLSAHIPPTTAQEPGGLPLP